MDVALSGMECEGAWRLLCSNMLFFAIDALKNKRTAPTPKPGRSLSRQSGLVKEWLRYPVEARAWIEGGVGEITFEECCEVMEVDPGRAKRMILEVCSQPGSRAC